METKSVGDRRCGVSEQALNAQNMSERTFRRWSPGSRREEQGESQGSSSGVGEQER